MPEWPLKRQALRARKRNDRRAELDTMLRLWRTIVYPIALRKRVILDAVAEHQVVIVVGQPASGKTTLIPEFLYEAGYGESGVIGVTEPRRLVVKQTALYVGQNPALKNKVGYKIRFDSTIERSHVIQFMTDGLLVREAESDPLLSRYSVLFIDEAHERSANIELVFGLLKSILPKRPDLKVVIGSATMNHAAISRFYGGAYVVHVPSRRFPITTRYLKVQPKTSAESLDAAAKTIGMILEKHPTGGILAFIPGVDELFQLAKLTEPHAHKHGAMILPAFSAMSKDDERALVTPSRTRKIILATNVAETSLTLSGISYVVDTGLIRQSHYDPETGLESLDIIEHSQAGCEQREGRVGREAPGTCYRLYTRENFEQRPQYSLPETKRMPLQALALSIDRMCGKSLHSFDFVDTPSAESIHDAYTTLTHMGAAKSHDGALTPLGKDLAFLGFGPHLGNLLLAAETQGCVDSMASIVACLSVSRPIFALPYGKELQAAKEHRRFLHIRSDMLTLLRVWNQYEASGYSGEWCWQHFLDAAALREAGYVREQILRKIERIGMPISHRTDEDSLLKSVAVGLSMQLFERMSGREYVNVRRSLQKVMVHSRSSLMLALMPRWIVATDIMGTHHTTARFCSTVNPSWLPELAPNLFVVGEKTIVERVAHKNSVEVREKIFALTGADRESAVGSRTQQISLAEARVLQEENIARALREGCLMLTAEKIARSDTV